ncbi:LAQU0S19e01068g1_1 [Lachancea quebecensis]|uniref:LAQU0S19e01068g1_1 n=1 Tax=Lachancea quebecensis TaxID=1654605 RepID=A0A0P1KWU1_9SACH|nr:LAQU0S19e01068g1_1 [Lachancea quebecensis]
MSQPPKIIFGAFTFVSLTEEEASEFVDVLKKYQVEELDTARIYPGSEEAIGKFGLPKSFIIDTKARAFAEGSLTKENINSSIEESCGLLGVDSVETFYLHCPDPATPLEETLDTIGALYKEGKFKKFGLSNFPPEDVRKIHTYNKEKGYVLPTVYQGNYNAVSRKIEASLFPVLRELGLSFYAYSPIAGGFLAKTPEEVLGGKGRFDTSQFIGQLYSKLYNKPLLIKGLEQWGKIADRIGITRASLAYRWIFNNSTLDGKFGDAVIIGARTPETLADNIESLKAGPLDPEVVKEIDEIWTLVEKEAVLDNYSH